MNIVFSSDDNYARHLAVSMTSILGNNTKAERIQIWVLNVGLSQDNINKLKEVVKEYNRVIYFVDFSDIKKRLARTDIPIGSFTIEMYTRLFLSDALPETEHRAMWIDGDTAVLGDIREMYFCDMKGCAVAAVVDQPSFGIQVSRNDAEMEKGPYFASGMFIADLDVWRRENISQKFVEYLGARSKPLMFPDQSVINHVLNGRIHILPFRCHVVTPSLFLPYKQMLKSWDGEVFYTKKEYKMGKRHPLIIHYAVFRPWRRWCLHPLKKYYRRYLKMTPYKDVPLENEGFLKTFNWLWVAVKARLKRLIKK